MVKNIKELIKDLHFLLKLFVLVLNIIKIAVVIEYFHNYFTTDTSVPFGCAYPLTVLSIIIALMAASIFFESTRVTEVCLLISCGLLIIDSMVTYDYHYGGFTHYKAKNGYLVYMILSVVELVLVILDIIFHFLKK